MQGSLQSESNVTLLLGEFIRGTTLNCKLEKQSCITNLQQQNLDQ